jgi:aspartyl-tRNA(Asn)/glutamyl-tRNA(Gln) amidotransferase subunit A
VDVLLTPVTLTQAPSFQQFSNSDNRTQTSKHDYCTQPVNLAGLPAATIPVKLSKDSLPIGLQIIGPKFGEQKILDVCKWLENRLEFSQPIIDD